MWLVYLFLQSSQHSTLHRAGMKWAVRWVTEWTPSYLQAKPFSLTCQRETFVLTTLHFYLVFPVDMLFIYENIWNLLLYCKNQFFRLALTHTQPLNFFCKSSSGSLQWAFEVIAGSLLSSAAGWLRKVLSALPGRGHPSSTDVFAIFLQFTKTQFIPMI